MGSAVVFNALSKIYGDVRALNDVDLSVRPGEFLTLLGPSGSGKSTMLNILAGFTGATSGDIQVDGESVLGKPPEKRNIGMVFQSYSLFPHMSVYDNIAFPLRLRNVPKAEVQRRVADSLEMIRMSGFADRKPAQLSGGQQQRIAFARAVVFEPSVLLMDEPLGALDLKLRQALQLEIKRYHRALGCTIIFVTHDQGEALALSDRVAVMNRGSIEQVDSPERIYDEPASRFVSDFVGRTNVLRVQETGRGLSFPEIPFEVAADRFRHPQERSVFASIRPEMLRRAPPDARPGAFFEGVVSDVLFSGDVIHYRVRTTGGMELLLQEQRGPGVRLSKSGETIRLTFDASHIRPIRGAEGE